METYKRSHGADQIEDGVKPACTGDFLVADPLADCKISQSKQLDVRVISVIALHHTLSVKQFFSEYPSKATICE